MKARVFYIVTALLGAAGPSLATPIFQARAETCCLPSPVLQEVTGNSFVSTGTNSGAFAIPDGLDSFGSGSVGAAALAGPGWLGAGSSATVDLPNSFPSPDRLDGLGTARLVLDDIVLSGPESTVPFTLNLHISGIRALDTSAASDWNTFRGQAQAESSVRLSGYFSFVPHDPEAPDFGGTLDRTDISFQGCATPGCVVTTLASSGIFDGFTGDDAVFTPTFEAPVGVPFSLDMELRAISTVLWGADFLVADLFASSGTFFNDTVSFPTDGPVFNLPPGFTANSVSGLIVDNRWTGGADTLGVPEPATLALLGLGLAGLGFSRRRQ